MSLDSFDNILGFFEGIVIVPILLVWWGIRCMLDLWDKLHCKLTGHVIGTGPAFDGKYHCLRCTAILR